MKNYLINIVNGLSFAKKALTTGECDILILDEPTAVLTVQEIDKLFDVMRKMKQAIGRLIRTETDRGMAITASYTYGWEDETWREMACAGSQVYNGSDDYMTLFQYGVPEEDTGKTVSTVKFKLDRPEGDVADELLGIANGDTQIFLLPHFARADTITCSGVWNYNEATRILTVQHTRGQEIRISYHWTAESHEVKAVAAGWAVTSG